MKLSLLIAKAKPMISQYKIYQVFDTAGLEKFKALSTGYYKKAHICVIVYDITCVKTFLKVEEWKKTFRQYNKSKMIILVGNKKDLNLSRDVLKEEINDTKEKLYFDKCFEVSSLQEEDKERDEFWKCVQEYCILIENKIVNEEMNIKMSEKPSKEVHEITCQ